MAEQKNSKKKKSENKKELENNKKDKKISNPQNDIKKESEITEEKIIEENSKKTINEEEIEEKVVTEKPEKEEKQDSFIKKHLSDIILIVAAIVIILIGLLCFNTNTENNLIELTYSEYTELIESNEPFVFIIERTGCSHCTNYMPVAKKVANTNNVPIYYIDTSTLTEDEFTALQSSNSFFTENAEDWGTPTTMVLKGSEAVDSIVGEREAEDLEEFLKENGIME